VSATPADAPSGLYRAALDALPEPILIYDDEHVLYANEAASGFLGGSDAAPLIGADVSGFVSPDLHDISPARRAYVLKGGIHLRNLLVKVRGIDGEPIALRVNIQPIHFDGRTAAMATLGSGATLAPRGAQTVVRAQAEPASLHAAALMALETALIVHGEPTIHFANYAACNVLGAEDPGELVGKDVTSIVHEDAREAGSERRKLVLEHGQPILDVPLKLRALDGQTLYARARAVRIEWDGGAGILIVATFPDRR